MLLKNTSTRYGIITKIFHWLMFLLLVAAIVGGNYESQLPDGPEKIELVLMHKSFGVLILLLLVLRFGWRLINPVPVSLVQGWQATTALIMHWLLYALMLAQPLSGLLMSQAAGYPVHFFGVFELPTLVEKSKPLAGAFHEGHELIWGLLALFALGHIGAALYHHFVKKDDVLRRMGTGLSAE